nr:MAG TPA: hypothetical protein [Microviridae sp.]
MQSRRVYPLDIYAPTDRLLKNNVFFVPVRYFRPYFIVSY